MYTMIQRCGCFCRVASHLSFCAHDVCVDAAVVLFCGAAVVSKGSRFSCCTFVVTTVTLNNMPGKLQCFA